MKRILLIGTALIDHLIYSPTPLQNDTCNKLSNGLCSGGSLRNVAHNLGKLNCPVDFLSCWGNDVFAQNIKDELGTLNIGVYGPIRDLPTPLFTAINTPAQNLTISSVTSEFIVDEHYDFPYENYDLVVTDIDNTELLTKIVSSNKELRFVTIGFLPSENAIAALEGAIFNRREFFATFGHDEYSTVSRGLDSWLVVTLDKDGVYYNYRNQQNLLKNKRPIKNGYPIGCGDALVAGLLYQLTLDHDFLTALTYAHDLAEQVFASPANII